MTMAFKGSTVAYQQMLRNKKSSILKGVCINSYRVSEIKESAILGWEDNFFHHHELPTHYNSMMCLKMFKENWGRKPLPCHLH